MVKTNKKMESVTITPKGFQGFDPVSKTLKEKLGSSVENPQIGVFQTAETVNKTDEDAGDGKALTYDAISYKSDKVVANAGDVPTIVQNLRDGKNVDAVVEYNSTAKVWVISQLNVGGDAR